MYVQQNEKEPGTFDLVELSADELALVAALAAFPLWSAQPKHIGRFCAALHNMISDVAPTGSTYLGADAAGLVPITSTTA